MLSVETTYKVIYTLVNADNISLAIFHPFLMSGCQAFIYSLKAVSYFQSLSKTKIWLNPTLPVLMQQKMFRKQT